MKLETWVDIADGRRLVKVYERFDNNDWPIADVGTVQSHCKTTGTPSITWGGPLCVFRSDNIESYDIRNASIRSITAPVLVKRHTQATKTIISFQQEQPTDL